MKSLYIIPFLFLSAVFYAQEKKSTELQDQEQVLRELKENAKKMQTVNDTSSGKSTNSTGLVSDHGLEVKDQGKKTQAADHSASQGKLLPSTASFEEILATIPNRQASRKAQKTSTPAVQGLPNTATLEQIKKTIPKN